ncbi:hypothetical protein BKK79_09980 [Cupriavidus sp. USMAA2-4]|uniref:Lipoprotein membrane protein n=1 Tax=Cupriavidus malaysiensis TaxID=367825 RepID=A0ABN4TKM0_9BURK|nr:MULTISPECIES: hypothetical protein [Cupriavidus]AOY94108.1 hypothetical protein BKK79_09980 [Cupriavidus sp. USMAA2-4]AOZ01077.1 hypothetical protein BKK81_02945 [Cupriavidus sp. USMAHM13]AOZ07903.1 hypothetical protein BKK80_02290 [Cupriavidus malaysiensis]
MKAGRWPSRTALAALLALLAALLGGCIPLPRIGGPTPIAYRTIDLAGDCRRTEEDGFREDAQLRVVNNNVQQLSWKLWVGKRGSCSFNLADFHQVKSRPSIALRANDGSACELMIWQDPRRVTLAHANCQQRCTPGIYEEAWPVLFEPGGGGCAQTR